MSFRKFIIISSHHGNGVSFFFPLSELKELFFSPEQKHLAFLIGIRRFTSCDHDFRVESFEEFLCDERTRFKINMED